MLVYYYPFQYSAQIITSAIIYVVTPMFKAMTLMKKSIITLNPIASCVSDVKISFPAHYPDPWKTYTRYTKKSFRLFTWHSEYTVVSADDGLYTLFPWQPQPHDLQSLGKHKAVKPRSKIQGKVSECFKSLNDFMLLLNNSM